MSTITVFIESLSKKFPKSGQFYSISNYHMSFKYSAAFQFSPMKQKTEPMVSFFVMLHIDAVSIVKLPFQLRIDSSSVVQALETEEVVNFPEVPFLSLSQLKRLNVAEAPCYTNLCIRVLDKETPQRKSFVRYFTLLKASSCTVSMTGQM